MTGSSHGAVAETFTLEFSYRRSVGPVIGAYLTGLRDGVILGSPTAAGRVLVPPLEYDPDTGEPTGPLVEVAETGTIVESAWVRRPMAQHPFDHPFAWALIRLDDADSEMVHAVTGDEGQIRRGARVRARWRDDREGHPLDIECFELMAPS